MIQTRDLTRGYGGPPAVDALSLSVPEGSIYGFIGPNGAGKSTTIRVLLGFLRAEEGEARILDQDCWRDTRSIKRQVGYLSGDPRLYGWMHGHDALEIASRIRGEDVRRRGHELGEALQLPMDVRVRAMSRGMRQKLGLILSLAHDPTVLILDEPTSALDPITQERLYGLLREMANRGATIFFSSHILSEVQDLCERVGIIRRGQLVAEEALSELREKAGRAVTIDWQEDAPPGLEPPDWLVAHEIRDDRWEAALQAPVPRLLEWLQGQPLRDLQIGPPDLDRLFMEYYRGEEARA